MTMRSRSVWFQLGALIGLAAGLPSCADQAARPRESTRDVPIPQFVITRDQKHHSFSRAIPPVLRVPSGAIIEAFTSEASDSRIRPGMTSEEYREVEWPDVFGHPLTGPVYVEGAEPGDILAVTLHEIEMEDWGWTDTDPEYSFLGT